MLVQISFSK